MAGKIKLDGTQFLEKVNNEFKITNSELKLKSTGNTIVDSSGNAVVSESGGNVTLGNVRLPSTGGIKDSSGNNILTESGGNVSVGNVRLPATGGIKDSSGNNILTESGGDVTISNSAIKLKSSGNSITKSDGTTAVLSESSGTVTVNNITAGSNISGIGQLIGVGYNYNNNTASSSIVTVESGKNYRVLMHIETSGTPHYGYADVSVAGDGTVTITDRTTSVDFGSMSLYSPNSNQILLQSAGLGNNNQLIFVFEV